jgi:anti-sigma regulatory factor (Ser/Thr protein kinase)
LSAQQTVGLEGLEFRIELTNTRSAASHARKQLVQFVEHFRIERQIVADIEAVAGEALANAAERGRRPAGTIRVEARMNALWLEVTISDDGSGFASRPVPVNQPPALSLRGYGFFIMHARADLIEVRDNGRTLWFLKHLQARDV